MERRGRASTPKDGQARASSGAGPASGRAGVRSLTVKTGAAWDRGGLLVLLATGFVAALTSAAAPLARAQETADERARVHFQAGRSYYDEGSYDRALSEFERAYELSQRHMMLLNISSSHERLGRLDGAVESLTRYLELVPDTADRAVLERRLANLRRRLEAQQAASAPPTNPAATTATGDPATAAPVAGGAVVEAPDGPGAQGDGTAVGEGSATGSDRDVQPDSGGMPTAALISYIAAGVGVVTFGVFGSLALSEESSVADGCGATRTCTDGDLASVHSLALLADIGLGVGLVGAVLGTALWLGGGSDDEDAAAVAVVPVVGRDGAGLAGTLRF